MCTWPSQGACGADFYSLYFLPQDANVLRTEEGVDGSSPSEGFTKGQQVAFFVASSAYAHRSIVPQSIPKIRPQDLRSPGVLA